MNSDKIQGYCKWTQGLVDVIQERIRQITDEGWGSRHDDAYVRGELGKAALSYILSDSTFWPWDSPMKPKGHRRSLVIAAALLIAEIERLDRAEDRAEKERRAGATGNNTDPS